MSVDLLSLYERLGIIRSVPGSTCRTRCGVNTWCTGNWSIPVFMTCSCFDNFLPPTNDGKNCTGVTFGVDCCQRDNLIVCFAFSGLNNYSFYLCDRSYTQQLNGTSSSTSTAASRITTPTPLPSTTASTSKPSTTSFNASSAHTAPPAITTRFCDFYGYA